MLVLDQVPASVLVKRVDDRKFLLANRHAEKLMGFTRKEIIGQRVEDIYPEERVGFINIRDNAGIARRGEVLAEEYPLEVGSGLRVMRSRRSTGG